MIPQITSFDTFGFAGGYPLAAAADFDAGAAPAVLVALTTSNGYAYVPAASYGGQPMTLLARTSTVDTGETTTWLWGLVAPPSGEQTISIVASEYCAPATGIVIALADVAALPFGETDAAIASPALTLSVETAVADCLLLAIGQAQSTSGVALTATGGFSLVTSASEGATTNILSAFETDAATPGAYSVTLTAPFNHVSGALVAIRGFGSGGIGVVGIGPGSAVGTPAFAIDRQAAVTGIAGMAAAGVPDLAVQGQEPVTGIAPGSAVGTPAVQFDATVTLIGISGAAEIGTPEVAAAGTFPMTLAPGESITFRVTFAPTVSGGATGALVLATSIGTRSLALSGTGAAVVDPDPDPISRLHIAGNQFVNAGGETVRLRTLNWHGAESGNQLPHAMWDNPPTYPSLYWQDALDHIKAMGFNCVRFPFSGDDCCAVGAIPAQGSISTVNADLAGLSTFDAWEKLFDYCASIGLYVVLDYHRNTPGSGAPPGAFTDKTAWIANWVRVAIRFADHPAIVGADVFNEPYQYSWDTWAGHAEDCGNAILAVAPDWLIFVEGTMGEGGDTTWWGGHLKGVATRPVVLDVASKVVYSPHEYGQSVGSQTWLKKENTPANWPQNLYPVWRAFWGFIFEQNIAPIWIGEFGGHYGLDAETGAAGAHPYATAEEEWTTHLIRYLNGDFEGTGVSGLTGSQKGMSAAYWTFGPLSGDTGGLVIQDYRTEQTHKLDIIAPFLED
ncbi:cellulase family glycosylhydrolase [Segnochrobactraceae bacterium EtOH-i3]